jgi:type IV secretory pathway VirB10-like protein
MLKALDSFITDISSLLTPEMALAGGVPFPPPRKEKPTLSMHKGGGGGGNMKTPKIPAPPVINIPEAPTPPLPPPPPTASSADVAAAQQQGYANAQKGFGFKASLLKGNDATTNTATGSGSLLGK